jgi:imidazolonepropionase-like amidohydrolase
MRRDEERGSIEPGKVADLILVPGDPTKRISDLRNVEIVLKGGVLYRPAEIDAEIGVQPPR